MLTVVFKPLVRRANFQQVKAMLLLDSCDAVCMLSFSAILFTF